MLRKLAGGRAPSSHTCSLQGRLHYTTLHYTKLNYPTLVNVTELIQLKMDNGLKVQGAHGILTPLKKNVTMLLNIIIAD
jgi:hypothetical protein